MDVIYLKHVYHRFNRFCFYQRSAERHPGADHWLAVVNDDFVGAEASVVLLHKQRLMGSSSAES
jgi:hypothetical protein